MCAPHWVTTVHSHLNAQVTYCTELDTPRHATHAVLSAGFGGFLRRILAIGNLVPHSLALGV